MGLKISRTASMLLNNESKSKARKYKEIQYIKRDRIHKNPKNRVSIDGIYELAQDIRMAGIEQPLVGYVMETGDYMLLTGERRLTAVDRLIEEGTWDPDNDLLPFVVVSLADYNLPLDDDLKERYAILRTNAFNRVMTDADRMVQAEDYKAVVKALKKQGYKEMIIGYDENGDPVSKDISGRTREVVAGMMGISTGQMGKIESIEKHGGEKLKEAVRSGDMSIAAASALSQYPEEDQDKFLDKENLSSATASSVTEAMKTDKWKDMNISTAEDIIRKLIAQNDMEMIRILFPDPAEEITESKCKDRIHSKYGFRGFDVYKSYTSSQTVDFFPRCITVKQEIVDPDWKMDIHEKIIIDWSKFLEIVQDEYQKSLKMPTEEEILLAWAYFKTTLKGMTANKAASYYRRNNCHMGHWGEDVHFDCTNRGITINEKEELTWFNFFLQAMSLDEEHNEIAKETDAEDFYDAPKNDNPGKEVKQILPDQDQEPDTAADFEDTEIIALSEELMKNINNRDWETALSNLGELEAMLRTLTERN